MITTLRIDRLSLDLRGIDPALAEAAVRLLGPALQAQMAQLIDPEHAASRGPASRWSIAQQLQPDGTAREHIDAGRVAAVSQPQALADRLAQRIAQSLTPPARKG